MRGHLHIIVLASAVAMPLAALPAQLPSLPAVEVVGDAVTARGRVVFVDLEGHEHLRPEGQAELVLTYKDATDGSERWTRAPLSIRNGRWTTWLTVAGKPIAASMRQCTIGGEAARVEPERITLTDAVDLVFRLHAIPELRLSVVDAASKEDLEEVEVLHERDCRRTLHPGVGGFRGDFERLIESARSPIVLPTRLRTSQADLVRSLWVRAPGHAWRRVDILLAYGGTRDVALVPSGSLAVTIHGPLPEPPAALALRLYRDRRHEEPATDFAIDAGKIETIDGLATGTYEVRVELGEWWSPCVLAKGEAVIEAGATTQLALRVQAMPAPAKVVVRGTLVLPPQWRVQTGTPVSLMLWPLDRTHWAESRSVDGDQLALDAGEDAYRFALHGVLVGSYEVTALPAWHRHVVNVPETGIADLRIVVPPPGEVILRVLDGVTKEPRNGTRVWWHTARAAGGMSAPALAAVDSHEVRFLAPVGPIVVSAFGDDYVVEPHDIDVRPGENEIELSTKPICGVKVALYEGGIRIPLSTAMGWRVQLDRVTGETLRGPMRNQDTPTVLDSGRYVLKVETPDDYQPVPDRTVTLSSGPFLPIEIQVTRKQ